jgi:hypothetical protein
MLSLKSLITPSAMLAAFSLLATPTFAGQRDHGREGSAQQSSGRAAERAQPRQAEGRAVERSQPRQAEGRTVERAQPRAEAVAPPRVETQRATPQAPRAETQRATPQAPRAETQRATPQAPRAETQRATPQAQRAETQRVSPQVERRRDVAVPRAIPRSQVVVPRGAYSPRYAPHYAPRYGYGVRGYYRPYVYRPRFSIGFGIYAGYPVPWAYSMPYPVEVYGYAAPRGPVMVTPGSNAYGGVALEITPDDAAVYVDGTYAGLVRDFDGSTQPLTLTGGTHRIDIEAQGFAPLSFDVGVQPGQVIPYRGDLQYQQ